MLKLNVSYLYFIEFVLHMRGICHRHFCNTGSRVVYMVQDLLSYETIGGHYYSLINLPWRSRNESEALLHIYKPSTTVKYTEQLTNGGLESYTYSTVLLNSWGHSKVELNVRCFLFHSISYPHCMTFPCHTDPVFAGHSSTHHSINVTIVLHDVIWLFLQENCDVQMCIDNTCLSTLHSPPLHCQQEEIPGTTRIFVN